MSIDDWKEIERDFRTMVKPTEREGAASPNFIADMAAQAKATSGPPLF
ncbi:MAG: hypothetical protein PHP86_19180 [Nevskiales bacterium]|nr:hypothetical protein [Nevskiales bacterium]